MTTVECRSTVRVQTEFARGGSVVSAGAAASRSGAGGLRTTGRTQTWEGPSVELASVLQTGATYAISAYARLVAPDQPPRSN